MLLLSGLPSLAKVVSDSRDFRNVNGCAMEIDHSSADAASVISKARECGKSHNCSSGTGCCAPGQFVLFQSPTDEQEKDCSSVSSVFFAPRLTFIPVPSPPPKTAISIC